MRIKILSTYPQLKQHIRRRSYLQYSAVKLFHVLMATDIKMAVFWDTVPCSIEDCDHQIGVC
jgi:hypothetical protein